MLRTLLKGALIALLASSVAFAKVGATLHGSDGDLEHTYNKVMKDMESLGYILADPHERINDAYKKKFGSTKLDNLGFFSTANDLKVRKLLEKHPKLGGFTPFNLHIWKLTKENTTWYGHLTPDTMADIVGMTDKGMRKKFADSFKDFDALAAKMMKPTKKLVLEYSTLPKRTMLEFEIKIPDFVKTIKNLIKTGVIAEDDFDDTEGLLFTPAQLKEAAVAALAEDEVEANAKSIAKKSRQLKVSYVQSVYYDLYDKFFEAAGYIIAGGKDFKEAYSEAELPFAFDAYWIKSLCHFPFSNGVFNDRPDVGIFAPCSQYQYIKEGGDTIYIGMPSLVNWVHVNNIKNKKFQKAIDDIDAEIIKIMTTKLNAKEVK